VHTMWRRRIVPLTFPFYRLLDVLTESCFPSFIPCYWAYMGLRPRTQPPQTEREQRLRNVIYIGLVVLVFGQAGLWAASSNAAKSQSTTLQTEYGWKPKFLGKQPEYKPHPIATLMADAEAKYRATLARQSTSLKEAVRVYQTRHDGRNPPKGFDKWWQFVTDHGVLLVDEFDSVSEDLEPFWQLTGEEFRARVKEVSVIVDSNAYM
jgi:hypothetical protein